MGWIPALDYLGRRPFTNDRALGASGRLALEPELHGIDPQNITCYFRRVMVIPAKASCMAVWRKSRFATMHFNANLPAAYFEVSGAQVVEVRSSKSSIVQARIIGIAERSPRMGYHLGVRLARISAGYVICCGWVWTEFAVRPPAYATVRTVLLGSSFQNEGHLHGHPVFVDLPVFHARFLLDHVKTGDAAQCLACAREALLDCGIEAGR
jgi:hypothetical protein